MTSSVGPNFTFSEHTCSRDDGVSLGIASCHPTEIFVIASGVYLSRGCGLQSLLTCFCHQQIWQGVREHNFVSVLADMPRVTRISPVTTFFLEVFARFPDRLLPVCFGVLPLCTSVNTTLSVTFRTQVR